ncbi:MAG TPA: ribosome silencing factor, partial [Dehalococcoidia bacterium]|nr:ribosome silencing factor [Dehalococcoidia bacterium]
GKGKGVLQADELAHKIIEALSEKQAEDILLLDIRNVASFADYFVIASTGTSRQMEAVLDSVEKALEADKVRPMGREGKADSGWVLLDYGDVIVHLFAPEERTYYDLEGLWHTAVPVVRLQ